MKLAQLLIANQTLTNLVDAILDEKLALKINRILGEIEVHVSPILKTKAAMGKDLDEKRKKVFLDGGAEIVAKDGHFVYDMEDKKALSALILEAEKINQEVDAKFEQLIDEEIPFELKSAKLTEEELAKPFRKDHKFLFSSLNLIKDFIA